MKERNENEKVKFAEGKVMKINWITLIFLVHLQTKENVPT